MKQIITAIEEHFKISKYLERPYHLMDGNMKWGKHLCSFSFNLQIHCNSNQNPEELLKKFYKLILNIQ